MQLVETALLIIVIFSLPNLIYRAEFNVPLLLFAAATWRNHLSTSAYLLVFSWALDLYKVITLLTLQDPELASQQKPILITSTIIAFVLKIGLIVYLVIKQQNFRKAISPQGLLYNIGNSLKGSASQAL